MNWVDFVIIAIVAWLTFAAFWAGIIREIVTIVGVALGIVLAGFFYEDLAEDIQSLVDLDENAVRIIAFLLIFGACTLAGQLTAMLLKHTASILMLGTFDHLFGAVFGLFKGIVVVEVLLIVFVTFPALGLKDAIDGSLFGPLFLDGIPFVLRVLPSEFDSAVEAFV